MTYFVETASIVVASKDSDNAAINGNIDANAEVFWHEWGTRTVLFENHLSLEESALWNSSINLLWLCDLDGLVLQVIKDNNFPNSVIFEAGLDNALLKVTVESQDL